MSRWCFFAGALTMALAAHVRGASAPTPVTLHIDIASSDVVVSFELSGNDAVGFQHRQRTTSEREAVGRVMRTLTNSGQWIRLNAEALCNSSISNVAANIYRTIDREAKPPKPPITKPAFDTSVTFNCRAIEALRSVDIMLLAEFPRIGKVLVEAHTPAGNRTDIITTPTATVVLAPNEPRR